ncbi:hypothetical protein FBUS_05823, partial [Fasciolopsis buskii]
GSLNHPSSDEFLLFSSATSPTSKSETLSVTESSCPSRVELRQCLPRALFADSAVVAVTKTLNQGKANRIGDVGAVTSTGPSHSTVGKCTDTHSHEPPLVLITCPRPRRKCHTPTKNLSGGESCKQASRHPKRSLNTSVPQSQPTASCTTTQPSHSDVAEYFSRAGESDLFKNSANRRNRHRRSVHETPDPEKSYPRWERAKLAAAEKTKGKAVIVEESPVKPLFCLGSPIRRLRRANSIRDNACDPRSQGLGIELTPNKSNLRGLGRDNSNLCLSQACPSTITGLMSGNCLSRTMSRAEQWRRRQLDEELSLSQFGLESTMSSNLESSCPTKPNGKTSPTQCSDFPTTASDSHRRSSNLFANMISPEHPAFQSPPKIPMTKSRNCAESTDTKSRTKHSSPTLERSSITSGKTPNRLGPIDQFVHTSSITMEQRLNKSVQRSRSTAPRSKLARAQLPASSPIETSRDIPVSPQIFDEEAMFLAREEFLNVTNTTSSGDMNTPTTSSGRGRYSTTNEEDFVYPQIGCSPMRKRRRLETVVSPDLIPPSSATYTHAVTGNPSNVARSDQLDFNLGRFTRLTRSRWGPVESPNKLVNGQKSPPQMIDSARSVRSPLVPLHIFNCSGQVGANGVAQYSDPLDHTTQSSQSTSAMIALRNRLFGNRDSDDSKLSNSSGLPFPSGNRGISFNCLSSFPENEPNSAVDENSRHLWDDTTLDLPISPGLRKLRHSLVERRDEPLRTSHLDLDISSQSGNRNVNRKSCPRPRRSLFR